MAFVNSEFLARNAFCSPSSAYLLGIIFNHSLGYGLKVKISVEWGIHRRALDGIWAWDQESLSSLSEKRIENFGTRWSTLKKLLSSQISVVWPGRKMERAMQPGVLSWSRSAGFLFIQCSVRYGAVGKVISESRLLTIGREFFLQAPFFDLNTIPSIFLTSTC